MTTRWFLIGALLLLDLGSATLGYGSTGGKVIPGIQTAGSAMVDTTKAIGIILSIPLIIGGIIMVSHHGIGGGLMAISGLVMIIAVMLYAEEIVAFIKPGASVSAATGPLTLPDLLEVWWAFGQQALFLGGLTYGLRRTRPARRV